MENTFHRIRNAFSQAGKQPDILIDMQGPEMRIEKLDEVLQFEAGDQVEVPIPGRVLPFLEEDKEVLLDDGKILARVLSVDERGARLLMLRAGELSGGKSIKIPDVENTLSALTEHDLENLSLAKESGVTGVMQPFVRSRQDLIDVRSALPDGIRLLAKVENRQGLDALDELLPYCDEIVIARGDLGNAMPLWELPAVQKRIAKACRAAGRDLSGAF